MADKRIRDEVEKLRKQLRTQRKGFEKRLSDLEKTAKKAAKSAEKEIAGLRAQVEQLVSRQKGASERGTSGSSDSQSPQGAMKSEPVVGDMPEPATASKATKPSRDKATVAPIGKTEGALEEMSVAQLRARAKDAGISGYSSMTKAKLIAALRDV
ncbi:Rho termination factor N-terminal domain-containing protein [uncultured Aeromicrobium sp.]|uniref:Rho termination factor N-terminal domain-containing protein n=1 Tax=uncultured Aeromicrobium sp. TaxID=337820 RepID=UPI0025FC5F6A|nr:Rho termination factor N-terminal domain-containing protein [uncultured Aeromicrobium sp.]